MTRLDEAATAALAGEVGDQAAAGYCCCYVMRACESVRDLERAGQWRTHVGAFCERRQFNSLFAVCRTQYAAVLVWCGLWADAERELEAAAAQFAVSRPAMIGEALVHLAELRRRQGRFEEAGALLGRAERHPLALLALSTLALDEGDAAKSSRLAERFLRQVPKSHRVATLAGQDVLLRARLALGQRERARSIADGMERVAAEIGTPAARASARLGCGLALASAAALEPARNALEDAVDLLGRAAAPFEQAQARVELARVLARSGDVPAAAHEARSAWESFERLGAARESERARTLREELCGSDAGAAARHSGLSKRETEVLRLLVQGQTNAEIAGVLFVSEFTIKRHVANILDKLDVPSRAAAAAHAVRSGLV
jgi:DNA-binding CsgD family transcriptional regulator